VTKLVNTNLGSVYANHEHPGKCPVLALAILLFSFPTRPSGKQQLFAGTNSKDRFGHLLQRVLLSLNETELQQLGCPVADIGSHSFRKGSSTYCLGQVAGPTPDSVFLRMGQTLGQLKDRYIHSAERADQLCGRMVAGLPFDSEKFAILPPHFRKDLLLQVDESYWTNIFSGYFRLPTGVKTALSFFLASIIYHEQFLREKLHPLHPIFASRVFKNNPLLSHMQGGVLLGIGQCKETELKATRIPPHLAVVSELNEPRQLQKVLRDELKDMKAHMC
jgi:hypothetical protein